MRNEKGQFVKGVKLTEAELLRQKLTRRKNYKHSEATILKIKISNTGKKRSEETKLKISVMPWILNGIVVKQCTVCKQIKPIEEFSKRVRMKCGYHSECKECDKEYTKNNSDIIKEKATQAWLANLEVNRAKSREYYAKDPEYQRKRASGYRLANPEKYRKQAKIRRIINPDKHREQNKKSHEKRMLLYSLKLSEGIAASIRTSLRGNKNGRHWENLVGYTLQELIVYLEAKFTDGMSWENRGKFGWHIDHIIPISFFEFNSFNDVEFKYCWSLNNLQPMQWQENLIKSNRVA